VAPALKASGVQRVELEFRDSLVALDLLGRLESLDYLVTRDILDLLEQWAGLASLEILESVDHRDLREIPDWLVHLELMGRWE